MRKPNSKANDNLAFRVISLLSNRGDLKGLKMCERYYDLWKLVFNAQGTQVKVLQLVDEKLLVLLRDGRKLLGILRSFDQFANAVIEGACERVIVGELYCDIPLGLYVIRGENVVLIGELDLDKEELPPHMTRVSAAEIRRAQKAEREASELKGTMKRGWTSSTWIDVVSCDINYLVCNGTCKYNRGCSITGNISRLDSLCQNSQFSVAFTTAN
ncbi:Sm-like protein LSM1B [Sesamum angolense]|uniref:U6 snRNA-associated Sm-like protein LSm1 n=1 Tax=Sesamum angolense TaxID=2727404 RepID=A0AAE1VY46_9LAMI|nr:Sm-like protein LSM1B [Sesamum angolense]